MEETTARGEWRSRDWERDHADTGERSTSNPALTVPGGETRR
jgi:hypothetical protein